MQFRLCIPLDLPGRFISGGGDGSVIFWSLDNPRPLFVLNTIEGENKNAEESCFLSLNKMKEKNGIFEKRTIVWITKEENERVGIYHEYFIQRKHENITNEIGVC